MIISIENLKEAKEFRNFIHKMNEKGIDLICDTIEESINHPEMSNVFIINTKNYENKK
jgi:hypothetical protein